MCCRSEHLKLFTIVYLLSRLVSRGVKQAVLFQEDATVGHVGDNSNQDTHSGIVQPRNCMQLTWFNPQLPVWFPKPRGLTDL